jgi:anti-sigma factor ChrR (cupin superfamily)
MESGTTSPEHDHPNGEEVFVLEGRCSDKFGIYEQGTWVRYPPGSRHHFVSETGCRLYVKSGHLGHA